MGQLPLTSAPTGRLGSFILRPISDVPFHLKNSAFPPSVPSITHLDINLRLAIALAHPNPPLLSDDWKTEFSFWLPPFVANDGVNLGARMQLWWRGCETIFHEHQQGLVGPLFNCSPYRYQWAHSDGVSLGKAVQMFWRWKQNGL